MRDGSDLAAILSLLESQTAGVLAMERDHHPYASLVAFSFSPDARRLYFVTPNDTTKYASLILNPNCAFLVDGRTNDPADFSRAEAVTAIGRARELDGDERAGRMRAHTERLPGLAGFMALPTIALFEIEVEAYVAVRGLTGVTVCRP